MVLRPYLQESPDSRLTEFRRHLQQQRLLTEARGRNNIQQKPEKETTTSHTGTDPIPQSTGTQTNGLTPSGVSPETGMSSSARISCPLDDRNLRPSVGRGQREGDTFEQQTFIVASPNTRLKRKHDERSNHNAYGKNSDVRPHLHMSCDILPCGESGPHEHTDQDVNDRLHHIGYVGLHRQDGHVEHDRTQHFDRHGNRRPDPEYEGVQGRVFPEKSMPHRTTKPVQPDKHGTHHPRTRGLGDRKVPSFE